MKGAEVDMVTKFIKDKEETSSNTDDVDVDVVLILMMMINKIGSLDSDKSCVTTDI